MGARVGDDAGDQRDILADASIIEATKFTTRTPDRLGGNETFLWAFPQ